MPHEVPRYRHEVGHVLPALKPPFIERALVHMDEDTREVYLEAVAEAQARARLRIALFFLGVAVGIGVQLLLGVL